MLLVGGVAVAGVSLGISIGPPPAPRVVRIRPANPGAGYVWIDGYWYPNGNRYRWHDGYYTRPAYEGAYWVGPRHENGRFFEGHWDGGHGQVSHDHRWDNDRSHRDFNHNEHDGDHR